MIETLLKAALGNQPPKEEEEKNGLGSIIVIGIILFVLLGGRKLFEKPE